VDVRPFAVPSRGPRARRRRFRRTDRPGVTRRDGWLCGPGIGDNAIAVATAAVIERALADPGERPLAVVFTVGEEGLGGLRGARHACRELAPEAVLALEGHGSDRVFTDAVGSLRVRLTVTELTAEVSPGLRLETERLDRRPAGSVPLAHPLVAAVLRARRAVGLPDATGDGLTDANAALAVGIPAVALGCCAGEDMPAPTERIRADFIAAGASQLQAVLAEILD
jgi:acetylornithine deacetylase/succinyl-diaminopimelate desuccinylase-like protein